MTIRRIIFAGLVMCLLIGVYAFTTSDTTTTYYLVRHAEKACEDCSSCDLSAPGKVRAAALADLLASKGIDKIYASECLRTQRTAKPLADRLRQPVNVYQTGSLREFINSLKKTSHRNILVVGHSDQIPMIINSIAHKRVFISNSDFDNLYIIRKSNTAKVKAVLESTTYGALSQ
jgi:2,3-bisphosphoglycerate-dependent phosphoglycerate mutase